MASKIKDRSFYIPVTPYKVETVEDEYNELSVMAAYNEYARCFYVSLHPGWRSSFGHGSMIMGDKNPLTAHTSVGVKESPRNSQKFIDEMYASLSGDTAQKIIRLLFDHRKWPILQESVRHIALNSAWATEELLASLTRQLTNNDNLDNKDNNSKQEETMAQNMKAADLIGKVIIVGDNVASITIKSADGDTLQGEFKKGDAPAIAMPIKLVQLEKMLSDKVWKIQGEATATADEVEEVEEIVVEGPKAETIDIKPKQEKSDKPKAKGGSRGLAPDSPQATHQGASPHDAARLRYETYTNKKGKTCAKIIGFGENDPAYVNAADLHGSATYERDKDGGKTFYLIFGPRYAEAAKAVCDALNAGKALKDCQAIIDKATEERARQRDEWKQKRGKTYTEAEVADLLKRVIAGDAEAMRIVNELNKAA